MLRFNTLKISKKMKKKTVLFSFVTIIFLSLLSAQKSPLQQKKTDQILYQIKNPSKNTILVVSHRGDWRYAPENSLLAIQRCIDLGVDIVEIDVQLTKDGHLVAMHDKTVDRTTNGKGYVSEMTLSEIKELRLKNACGVRGSKQQVPTLKEIMLLTKNKIMVNLDKVEGITVKEAYEILKETGTLQQVIFKGRESVDFMMNKYGGIMKEIIYMPIIIDNVTDASYYVDTYNKALNPVMYEVTFTDVDTDNFKQIKRLNSKGISVLTIPLWDSLVAGRTDELALIEGPDAAWGWLIKQGTNAIMTDRPEELLDYLKSKGLRNF